MRRRSKMDSHLLKKRGIRILDPRLAGADTPKVDEACWRGREMCGFMLYDKEKKIPKPEVYLTTRQ